MKIAAPDLSQATVETAPLYAYILILVQEINRMNEEIAELTSGELLTKPDGPVFKGSL